MEGRKEVWRGSRWTGRVENRVYLHWTAGGQEGRKSGKQAGGQATSQKGRKAERKELNKVKM